MKTSEKFWIGTFILLWIIVSTVSTFHSIKFFNLSNNDFLSWALAISFEIGAMASLGGIIISRGDKTLIWILFIVLTLFQIHGNMYWCWVNSGDISNWINLFGLQEEDPNFSRRLFSFVSGGILPLVSLGFIKSLMSYLKPESIKEIEFKQVNIEQNKDSNEFLGGHTGLYSSNKESISNQKESVLETLNETILETPILNENVDLPIETVFTNPPIKRKRESNLFDSIQESEKELKNNI